MAGRHGSGRAVAFAGQGGMPTAGDACVSGRQAGRQASHPSGVVAVDHIEEDGPGRCLPMLLIVPHRNGARLCMRGNHAPHSVVSTPTYTSQTPTSTSSLAGVRMLGGTAPREVDGAHLWRYALARRPGRRGRRTQRGTQSAGRCARCRTPGERAQRREGRIGGRRGGMRGAVDERGDGSACQMVRCSGLPDVALC